MICCTGLSPEQKGLACQRASDLGVLVSADLTSECTHLVGDSVVSAKYRYAAGHQTPVVSTAWLEACAKAGKLVSEQPYLLAPFHKLTIVMSGQGLSREARVQAEADVQREGGSWLADLDKSCTHLVTTGGSPKWLACRTQKEFKHVKVVSPAWLSSCVRSGVCAEESLFQVPEGASADELARDSSGPLEEMYLRACVLYMPLAAFDASYHHTLVAAVRRGGGTRLSHFAPWVTHVVLGTGGVVPPELRSGTPVVTGKWLLACRDAHTLLPVDGFLWRGSEEAGHGGGGHGGGGKRAAGASSSSARGAGGAGGGTRRCAQGVSELLQGKGARAVRIPPVETRVDMLPARVKVEQLRSGAYACIRLAVQGHGSACACACACARACHVRACACACACACLLAWTPSTGMALRNSSRETSPSPSSSQMRNISTTCAPCFRSAREICSSTGTCTGTPPSYSTCGLMPSHGRALGARTPFLRPSLSILRSSYRTCARLSRGAATVDCSSSGGGSIACPRRSTSWICLSPMQPDPSLSKRSKSSSRASGPAGRFKSGCTARRNSRFEMAPSPSRSHD